MLPQKLSRRKTNLWLTIYNADAVWVIPLPETVMNATLMESTIDDCEIKFERSASQRCSGQRALIGWSTGPDVVGFVAVGLPSLPPIRSMTSECMQFSFHSQNWDTLAVGSKDKARRRSGIQHKLRVRCDWWETKVNIKSIYIALYHEPHL